MKIRDKIFGRSFLLLLFIFFIPGKGFAASSTLLITEFKISGESSTDEYVTIKNISHEDINLDGYTLSKRTSSTSTSVNFVNLITFTDKYIHPNESLTIAHNNYSGDIGGNGMRYSTSNSITSSNVIAIRKPDKSIVDMVGFGNAYYYEGEPLPEVGAEEIYRRTGNDTDNNYLDFELVKVVFNYDVNLSKIMITEIYPAPESGQAEWFEIYNPTNQPISLFGLKVCDGAGSVRCFAFKKEDKIQPFAQQTFDQKLSKITLNNTGDWLELYDQEDNLLQATDNFGSANMSESFSLFGSNWEWSLAVTKNLPNVFVPLPDEPVKKKKVTTKKPTIKKLASSNISDPESDEEISTETEEDQSVKGETTAKSLANVEKFVDSKVLGYFIIFLAIILFCGYILWENKRKIIEIYHKIKRRND